MPLILGRSGTQYVAMVTQLLSSYCVAPLVEPYCKESNISVSGDIALCSWARHFTLTVPLSTQVYKWVPVNLIGEVWNPVCCHGNTTFELILCCTFTRTLLQRIKHFCYKLTEISFFIIFDQNLVEYMTSSLG